MQKLQNFEVCQQYLKTLVYNKNTKEKHECQISGVNHQRDGGRSQFLSGDLSPSKAGGITAQTYTNDEWSKLTKEEREKIKELRKQRKNKNWDTSSRNAAAVNMEDDEDDDDSSYSETSTANGDMEKAGNVSSVNKEAISGSVTGPPTRRSGRLYQS